MALAAVAMTLALCAVPARAFVARTPLSTRLPLSQLGPAVRHLHPPAALGVRRGRQGAQLAMCGGMHGLLNTAALIGASLPDTPLTTNLGVPSPVLAHQVLFLASNVGYFIAGAAILRTRASPKTVMGVALWTVGVASVLFHYFQCVMPVGSPVTTAFCALDSVLACSQFVVFGSMCWQALVRPTPRLLIGWPLAFLFYMHAGAYYTLTHALWHVSTAYLAYSIVEDRDDVVASGRPRLSSGWSRALEAGRAASSRLWRRVTTAAVLLGRRLSLLQRAQS
eukprot:Tamp_20764.p1 GENE.Tamp_20764~~Tamp_20764.p1  ORF type:complete len:288 (+),score=40.70 Tamp_20764:27-866(+)